MNEQIRRLRDQILDASILFSFDAGGFERHAQRFEAGDLDTDLTGRVVLVTGANGGLGKPTTAALAARGARVWMLVRNAERGAAAAAEIRSEVPDADLEVARLDVADADSIERFVTDFDEDAVDALVHNAGALPDRLTFNERGIEMTFATHVVGPYVLTRRLESKLHASGRGRVVWVSSGGMYTERLDVDALVNPGGSFRGTQVYARAKRAQVVTSEMLDAEWADPFKRSYAMHPGWAATAGVRDSLPTFSRLMRNRLRTPEQGADTIVWLAAADAEPGGGRFFFDRRPVSTHYLPWTREAPAERRRLLYELDRLTESDSTTRSNT